MEKNIRRTAHPESESFDYFPETFSMIPQGMERGALIIREIPTEVLAQSKRIVPLFSLYAQAVRGNPMLLKMILKSGLDPYEFVENLIIKPFLKQYLEMVMKLSITMEPMRRMYLLE